MNIYRQTFQPEIKCYHFTDNSKCEIYHTFSSYSKQTSGKGLQNYSFSRSVNSLVGSFSFSIKEDITDSDLFMDKVQLFDVIQIYEHGTREFIGIVRNISFSAIAGTSQKLLTISGQSLEGLFDLFKINFDYTAMNFVDALPYNIEFFSQMNNCNKDGTLQPLSIKDCVQKIIAFFMDLSLRFNNVSSTTIGKMIQYFYGITFTKGQITDVSKVVDGKTIKSKELTTIPTAIINDLIVEGSETDFYYPISTNLVSESEIKSFDLIHNLLPEQVYEIFGCIRDRQPVIVIREKPFDSEAWNNLGTAKSLDADIITDYSFTLSNDQVYTAFIPYVENSSLSPQLSFLTTAASKGYKVAAQTTKTEKYGYQPLQVNFIGFTTSENKKDSDKSEDDILATKMSELSTKLSEWYGNLDEMYSGNVTVVNILKKSDTEEFYLPKIGEKAKLCGCEFYVSEESHSWSFNSYPTISYKLDRGVKYSAGTFHKATGLSKQFAEILK